MYKQSYSTFVPLETAVQYSGGSVAPRRGKDQDTPPTGISVAAPGPYTCVSRA
jgi:hypothetical protein